MKKTKTNKPDLKIADVISQYTGQGWVYSKIVKEHFFHPRNLLLKDPKLGEFNAEGQVGSPACILGQTKIYTNPGIVSISKLSINEKVLSHDGTYNPIRRIFNPWYRGQLIKLKTQLGEIVTTPDHLIYTMRINRPPSFYMRVADKKRRSIIGWHHAADLVKGDMCLYPIPKQIKIAKYLKIKNQKRKFDFSSRSLPTRIKVDKNFLELAGYFIADGYTKSDKSEVGFAFAEHEGKYAQRVKTLIKKIFCLPSSISYKKEENQTVATTYNIHLAQLFSNLFGSSADTKHVPNFMMFLPPNLQRSLILGLWRGDGYVNLKRIWPRAGYSTISYELAQQIKLLLLRQKIIPSIYKEKEKSVKGVFHQKNYRIHVGGAIAVERLTKILKVKFQRDPSKKTTVRAWLDKDYLYLPLTGVDIQKFNGRLFNLEISDTHTYVTDAFLVHNCGDVMRMWLKVDRKTEKIKKLKWRTFGCSSAIAATSMFSVVVTEKGGMKIDEALKIRPQDIMARLGGLPARKVHCSVLADKAFRAAVNNYFRNTDQHQRVIVEGSKVIDKRLNITERDIEEAVLEGARTLEDVQKRLKVGVGDPEAIPEIEQLIRFYKEKYYGK